MKRGNGAIGTAFAVIRQMDRFLYSIRYYIELPLSVDAWLSVGIEWYFTIW